MIKKSIPKKDIEVKATTRPIVKVEKVQKKVKVEKKIEIDNTVNLTFDEKGRKVTFEKNSITYFIEVHVLP